VALYALSYDEPDALAAFAATHGVTFPLMSDPDSEVIERFGILNTLIGEDDHPWYGIPFPGAYVLAADGTITAKFFEERLQFRPSANQLLRAALGETIELPPLDSSPETVAFDVSFDGEVLHPGVMHDLIVRFAVPDGQHLYDGPVPDGMVATSVEVDEQVGVVVRPAVLPPTATHTLAGTGETLQIFDGDVVVRVPFTQLGRSLTELDDGTLVQRLTGTVRWQSCDDEMCHLPRTEQFSLDIPATRHDSPDGAVMAEHFTKMVSRHSDLTLGEVFGRITAPDDA
jgi:hypothetical protein